MKFVEKEIFIVKVEGFEDTAFDKRDEAVDFYLEMRAEYRNASLQKVITTTETLTYYRDGVWL